MIRVLRVLKLLRLQRLASASSLLYQQYVLITVTIFTIMFISAGIMQVLDGQIPKLTILPYFDYLYMNVVLLSTAGYGDIVPITAQNKLFVLVLLLTAGSIVSVQVRNIGQFMVFKNVYRDTKCALARVHALAPSHSRRTGTRFHLALISSCRVTMRRSWSCSYPSSSIPTTEATSPMSSSSAITPRVLSSSPSWVCSLKAI